MSPLAESLVGRVKRIVTLGKDAPTVAAVADQCGIPHVLAVTMEDAVAAAANAAAPGDLVLLSPACASLDMFDNFQQRGDVFASAVRSLTGADFAAVQS